MNAFSKRNPSQVFVSIRKSLPVPKFVIVLYFLLEYRVFQTVSTPSNTVERCFQDLFRNTHRLPLPTMSTDPRWQPTDQNLKRYGIDVGSAMDMYSDCFICGQKIVDPVKMRCGDVFCFPCLKNFMDNNGHQCPICELPSDPAGPQGPDVRRYGYDRSGGQGPNSYFHHAYHRAGGLFDIRNLRGRYGQGVSPKILTSDECN